MAPFFSFASFGGGIASKLLGPTVPVISATVTGGVTTIDSGGFRIHVFTSPGSFIVSDIGPGEVDYLVVAGGGGGGQSVAGSAWEAAAGGGAGGFRTGEGFPISATTYPITVGTGGGSHANGNPSTFSTITSTGGGRGGGSDPVPGAA